MNVLNHSKNIIPVVRLIPLSYKACQDSQIEGHGRTSQCLDQGEGHSRVKAIPSYKPMLLKSSISYTVT